MICQNCKKQIPRESVYCMFCGAPIFSADRDTARTVRVQPTRRTPEVVPPPRPVPQFVAEPPRFCVTCGTLLPEGYDGDVCDACLFVQDIAAGYPDDEPAPAAPPKPFCLDDDFDLDAEYRVTGESPAPAVRKKKAPAARKKVVPRGTNPKAAKWLLPVLLGIGAVIVLAVGALVVPHLLGGRGDQSTTTSASAPSTEEQDVIGYAQEMVKAAARDPASVHFDRATAAVSRDVSDFIITQTFERADASGTPVAATYEVVLELAPSDGKKYTPLLLKVDEETVYDYR